MLDERFSDTSDRLSRLKVYDAGEEDADEKKCDSDTSEGKAGDTTEETREDILAFGGEGKGCDDSDEEMILCSTGGSEEDNEFDAIVGALEGIIIDNEFSDLQNNFCREHCDLFSEEDENKIEYTKVFNRYTSTIESYIEERLQQMMPGFRMERFARMCHKRKHEITGDVFDILLSCGDFCEFKFLMLSHKFSKQNGAHLVLSAGT